ncbi:MAG: hypothetical protein JRE40_14055 [Deltaproteobacteria bacterium]|nr:hypothetical protein [Deltaproteobacteria bacterium]
MPLYSHYQRERGRFKDSADTRYEIIAETDIESFGAGKATFLRDGRPQLIVNTWIERDNILEYATAVGLSEVSPTAGATTATAVAYDNTASGMAASNVQDAIDEIDTELDKTTVADTYSALEAYDLGAIVEDGGSLYFSLMAVGAGGGLPSATPVIWEPIGSGAVSLHVGNDWAATTAYAINEVVVESGYLYRRLAARTSGATFDAIEEAFWQILILDPTMVGAATTGDTGVKGSVPKPSDDEQNQFLRGDATFGASVPLWITATDYEIGDIVYESDIIYRCAAVHTSGVFATDLLAVDWIALGPADMTAATTADAGVGGFYPHMDNDHEL